MLAVVYINCSELNGIERTASSDRAGSRQCSDDLPEGDAPDIQG